MPARSVCLVTLSLSEAVPGRFGCQLSLTDIYHTIPYHTIGPHCSRDHAHDVKGLQRLRLPAPEVLGCGRQQHGPQHG